ncbi:DUF3180 domain-containing protein [Dietzia sp.]|uniref:DUF3180 domain-containing protein n=1 Tax=Dietzia sp. TaxID=1871616 RepID=UPI002FDAFCCD
MDRTNWTTVVLIACVAFAVGIAAGLRLFSGMPPLSYLTAVPVALVCVVDLVLGLRVRSAIAKRRVGLDRSQTSPHTVVVVLALAKASTVLGAVIGGAGAGYAIPLGIRAGDNSAAAHDLPVAIVLAVLGFVLCGIGLLTETWCKVPPGDDAPRESSRQPRHA